MDSVHVPTADEGRDAPAPLISVIDDPVETWSCRGESEGQTRTPQGVGVVTA